MTLAITGADWSYTADPIAPQRSFINPSNYVWRVVLPPRGASGPYVVAASTGSTTIKLFDVYFGEVFYCGGQSNMVRGFKTFSFFSFLFNHSILIA